MLSLSRHDEFAQSESKRNERYHQSTGTGVRIIKYHIYDPYRGTR